MSQVYLERDRRALRRLRGYVWRNAARHPRHARNASWPGGLRADAGLAPPPPAGRHDLPRWTRFNATHALLPDDHRAVAPLTGAHKRAVDVSVQGGVTSVKCLRVCVWRRSS